MDVSKAVMVERLKTRIDDTSFAGEMGLDLAANKPMPLFLWLVGANLFSARYLEIGYSADDLAAYGEREDLPVLLSGLLRAGLDGALDEIAA